jgi:hypothetical protein
MSPESAIFSPTVGSYLFLLRQSSLTWQSIGHVQRLSEATSGTRAIVVSQLHFQLRPTRVGCLVESRLPTSFPLTSVSIHPSACTVFDSPPEDIPRSDVSLFQLLIKRQNGVYAWPDTLEAWMPVPDDPTRTVFGVWNDRAVAIQLNRRHRLAVGDLQSGDALSMELYQLHPHWHVEELELEFFQIDMYFTMKSRGPRTPLESG